MGNMMCCEQNNPKNQQKKERQQKDQVNPQKQIQPTYYTNPAVKDEDFTFNDKIKMQSIMNKYEVNYVPDFNQINNETQWYGVAQTLIEDINRINLDPEWASTNPKTGFELIYSQQDEKIFFAQKQVTNKQLNSAMLNISTTSNNNTNGQGNGYQDQSTTANESFRNSVANNGQNSFQTGPQLVSNPDINRNKQNSQARKSVGTNASNNTNMIVNIVKLEFEVNCSAEKMLKGLHNLKRFTNKIQKQTIIDSSVNKEFSISHIVFSKQMQKVQRDLVVANYYTDIGPNLNNCYMSVNHHSVPELTDVLRAQIIKAGHTFFEQYDTNNNNQLTSSHRPPNSSNNMNNSNNNRKSSQINNDENSNSNNNNIPANNNAFGSMNLNIGQIKTKVRFYGEFFCKNTIDENMVRMVFLTEFREYIAICKTISIHESVSSSEYDCESMDKDVDNTLDEANHHNN